MRKISVIIPTRDRVEPLRAAIASVRRQEDVEVEIVVVDDGSGPDAAEAARRLADDVVRVVRNPTSRRPAGARNVGIDAATAEWVAFLDDDDIWAPDKLQAQLAALERSGAAWAWSGAAYVTADRELLYIDRGPTPEEARAMISSGTVIPAGSSNVIASRELLLDLGGFDERVFHLPDWDMWLRLMLADPGASCPEPHVAYVQHDSMLSHRHSSALRGDVEIIEAKVRRNGLQREDAMTDGAMLEWYAESHVASGDWQGAARTYLTWGLRHRSPGTLALAAGSLGGRRGLAVARRLRSAVQAAKRRLRSAPEHEELVAAPVARPAWLDEVPVTGP